MQVTTVSRLDRGVLYMTSLVCGCMDRRMHERLPVAAVDRASVGQADLLLSRLFAGFSDSYRFARWNFLYVFRLSSVK